MGWVAWIAYSRCGRIKVFVQEEKNTGGKGRKGSFQVKKHPAGFIGSTDDIIFSIEPDVRDDSQVFGGGGGW